MTQIVIEIENNKVEFVSELLRNLKGVKFKVSDNTSTALAKKKFLNEMKQAFAELNEIKKGGKSGKPIQKLLDEL